MPQPQANPWRALIICPGPEFARRLGSALLEAGVTASQTVGEYPAAGAVRGLVERSHANICFLDVASDQERALALVAVMGAIPVVAVHPQKDADLILRCLRRGVREYLADPSPEGVRGVVERLTDVRDSRAGRRPGVVYCVIPGKPGCGASTVAVHLALQMRSAGKVLLVDADPLTASVAFMLNLKSEFHLGDAIRDASRLDQDLWARLTVSFSGIDVLLAPDTPSAPLELGPPLASRLFDFWRQRYDVVVVDTADLRSAVESGIAANANSVLLITTNELAAVHATRRSMEFLNLSLAQRGHLKLVVNRYAPAVGLKREDLRTVLQAEPVALLSNDYESVQDALLDGKPVRSKSRFQSSLMALSEQLQGKQAESKKSGFLHSLLKPNS